MQPRKTFYCSVCSSECTGFSRKYCSQACRLQAAASRKLSRRIDGKRASSCAWCGTSFDPIGSARTCSTACSESLTKARKSVFNRDYHQSVRKKGLVPSSRPSETKEESAERARLRRQRDPEKAREINRKSRAKHAERARLACKRWREANPDAVAKHRKLDYLRHKDRFRRNEAKRKERKRSAGMDPADITRALELLERCGNACAYCGSAVEGKRNRQLDHVIPLALGGPDTLQNLVVACASCNRSKWHRMPLEWLSASGHEACFRSHFPDAYERLLAWEKDQRTLPFEPNPWLSIDRAATLYEC